MKIIVYNSLEVPYRNNSRATWNHVFLPAGFSNQLTGMWGGQYEIYSVEECTDIIRHSVTNVKIFIYLI